MTPPLSLLTLDEIGPTVVTTPTTCPREAPTSGGAAEEVSAPMQSQPNGAAAPTNDAGRYAFDPTRRWSTRHRGISFRLNRDLRKRYFVYDRGNFLSAGTT